MNLTAGQEQALKAIADIRESHPEGGGVVVIAGYAGTGKTTLLGVLAEQDPTMFVLTPTGKAALRVKEAASCDAMTIHKWLYKPYEDPETNDVKYQKKDVGELRFPTNGLLIIDEASMLGFGVFRDLYSYARALGLNMVFVGDNFQLPPVEPNPEKRDFSVFAPEFPATIKVQLTEVVRQALDSPIIRASMAVRTDRHYLDSLSALAQVRYEDIIPEATKTWKNGGVVICHRNATRHEINAGMRKALGRPEEPIEGEPLLVLQNNYGLDVYNGEVLELLGTPETLNVAPMVVTDRFKNASVYMNFLKINVSTPMGIRETVIADREVSGENGEVRSYAIARTAKTLIRSLHGDYSSRESDEPPRIPVLHANWGYSLTCHKSQGSEFPSVLVVIEPSARVHTADGRRWVYTAITRAKKDLRICWT